MIFIIFHLYEAEQLRQLLSISLLILLYSLWLCDAKCRLSMLLICLENLSKCLKVLNVCSSSLRASAMTPDETAWTQARQHTTATSGRVCWRCILVCMQPLAFHLLVNFWCILMIEPEIITLGHRWLSIHCWLIGQGQLRWPAILFSRSSWNCRLVSIPATVKSKSTGFKLKSMSLIAVCASSDNTM